MLKTIRFLILPMLLLAMAAPAWADDINIIFDPMPAELGTFYLIQSPGTVYDVSWGSCTQSGVPSALQGDQGCMLFINQLPDNATITQLNLTFTPNAALAGQTIMCTNLDAYLNGNDCADAGELMNNGIPVTVSFYGLGVPNEMAFFIAENGVAYQNLPPVEIEVPTHDPGTLVLLLAGIALLGMCGVRRYA